MIIIPTILSYGFSTLANHGVGGGGMSGRWRWNVGFDCCDVENVELVFWLSRDFNLYAKMEDAADVR